MKKEKKEVLSRREFFKKAAKGALPILGAILMASMPSIANAEEKEATGCMGCANTCMASCKGSCNGGCKTGCLYECKGGCKSSCRGTCKNSCYKGSY